MIKYVSFLIFSTFILVNINAFSMDTGVEDPTKNKNTTKAQPMNFLPFDDNIFPNEAPLLTKPEFAALIFFKFFIQAPIEMADVLASYTSAFLSTDDNLCSDNYIYNFKEIVDYKEDDDS